MPTLNAAVDLVHLDRYTGGVRALNEEVLRLFDAQCGVLIANLEEAAADSDAKAWRLVTHTLKGAARGIGAGALAEAAALAEKVDVTDEASRGPAIARLRVAMTQVQDFIVHFLG